MGQSELPKKIFLFLKVWCHWIVTAVQIYWGCILGGASGLCLMIGQDLLTFLSRILPPRHDPRYCFWSETFYFGCIKSSIYAIIG